MEGLPSFAWASEARCVGNPGRKPEGEIRKLVHANPECLNYFRKGINGWILTSAKLNFDNRIISNISHFGETVLRNTELLSVFLYIIGGLPWSGTHEYREL
jgi:hypothetical protein